ncbi:hypothetical protein RFI_23971, partial [Reticulomyxa filosa]
QKQKHAWNVCKGMALLLSHMSKSCTFDIVAQCVAMLWSHLRQTSTLQYMCVVIQLMSLLPSFDRFIEILFREMSILQPKIEDNISSSSSLSFQMKLEFIYILCSQVISNKNFAYLLTNKFIFTKQDSFSSAPNQIAILNYIVPFYHCYLTDDVLLHADVTTDTTERADQLVVLRTLRKTADIWQDPTFLRQFSSLSQQYLSKALILMVRLVIARLQKLAGHAHVHNMQKEPTTTTTTGNKDSERHCFSLLVDRGQHTIPPLFTGIQAQSQLCAQDLDLLWKYFWKDGYAQLNITPLIELYCKYF